MQFDQLGSSWARAKEATPEKIAVADYLIAGLVVRTRIVGTELAAEIDRPLAHLRVSPDKPGAAPPPDLAVDLWDAGETGIAWDGFGQCAEYGLYGLVTATEDSRYIEDWRQHAVMVLDRSTSHVVGCVRTTGERCLDERARPFHRLLSVWLKDREVQFVHAGLVARNGAGILFVGKGGSGKSTSSIMCLRAGFGYLGDDFVGVQANPAGGFTGHSLYSSCLVDLGHLERFPDFAAHAAPPNYEDEDKSLLCLADVFPDRMMRDTQISAVVLPRVTGGDETRLRKASRAETLLGLAPSSIMYLPGAGAGSMTRLAGLVRAVPGWHLDLAGDPECVPPLIESLLPEGAP